MDKIKTPVRYDADAQIVWTDDNVHLCDIRGYGYLTGTGGLHLSDKLAAAIQDGWGRQIANALNNAADQSHVCPKCKIEFVTRMPKCPICYHRKKSADQSRVIEVMRTALEIYDDKSNWFPLPGSSGLNRFFNHDGSCVQGWVVAQDALAEAQRIMEGK